MKDQFSVPLNCIMLSEWKRWGGLHGGGAVCMELGLRWRQSILHYLLLILEAYVPRQQIEHVLEL